MCKCQNRVISNWDPRSHVHRLLDTLKSTNCDISFQLRGKAESDIELESARKKGGRRRGGFEQVENHLSRSLR